MEIKNIFFANTDQPYQAKVTKSGTGVAIYATEKTLHELHEITYTLSDSGSEEDELTRVRYMIVLNLAYEVRKASYGLRLRRFSNDIEKRQHLVFRSRGRIRSFFLMRYVKVPR